ncbi:kinase-like domain-containing protein [Fusarium acuminatum]|uniref:Kinase-like domain-containing protein n=1 Tax=Fusarium acuminatum TaxID=5515 RepID=A0ABZ2WQL4_9HYPO
MAAGSHEADCASIWGDFVDSDDECEVEDECEPAERYDEGLYYPVCIGEVLANRFRVEHKLGHGGFSTVWMAHDMSNDNDVALKIMTPGPSGEREYAAQDMIASTVHDTSRLLMYRETFLLEAPKTHHRVFVFPLLGPSLRTHARSMSIAVRMASAKQMLQAIKALHDGGVVHRDINSANVLYGLAPFKGGTTVAGKYEYLGRPQKMPIYTNEPIWKDGQLVKPIAPHNSIVQGTITLGDFGLAVKSGTSVEFKFQSPAIYCAPERFHNMDPDFASDMWSYMCIFFELCLGFPLFGGSASSRVVEFMVRSLGPLPSAWRGSYDGGGQYDESWYDQNRGVDSHLALELKATRSLYGLSPVEQKLVLSILQRGLSYSPEDRFSAGQLLEDASFKELMALHGL